MGHLVKPYGFDQPLNYPWEIAVSRGQKLPLDFFRKRNRIAFLSNSTAQRLFADLNGINCLVCKN